MVRYLIGIEIYVLDLINKAIYLNMLLENMTNIAVDTENLIA